MCDRDGHAMIPLYCTIAQCQHQLMFDSHPSRYSSYWAAGVPVASQTCPLLQSKNWLFRRQMTCMQYNGFSYARSRTFSTNLRSQLSHRSAHCLVLFPVIFILFVGLRIASLSPAHARQSNCCGSILPFNNAAAAPHGIQVLDSSFPSPTSSTTPLDRSSHCRL